jgi:hypothetical protein
MHRIVEEQIGRLIAAVADVQAERVGVRTDLRTLAQRWDAALEVMQEEVREIERDYAHAKEVATAMVERTDPETRLH